MTTLTLGILLGLTGGLGLTGLVYAFVPPGLPHLGDAVDRMTPQRAHYMSNVDAEATPSLSAWATAARTTSATSPASRSPPRTCACWRKPAAGSSDARSSRPPSVLLCRASCPPRWC